MIDPIEGLSLVIAQSPEVARMQMPTLQQITLANARTPAVISRHEGNAEDVASVQPAFHTIAAGPGEADSHGPWVYTRQPRKSGPKVTTAPIDSQAIGTIGSVVDLAA